MDCPPVAAGAVLYVVMPMFLLFGSVMRMCLIWLLYATADSSLD